MYDISQLKNDLAGVLHGTTLNSITNLDGLINRAGRQLLEDIDPQETKRIVQIATPVYDSVWDYPVPVDLKGNKVIDIRPQVNRTPRDIFLQQYNQAFDVSKQWPGWNNNDFTINFNTSVKSMRINAAGLPAGVVVNNISSTNENGTWTVGGGADNLTVDNQNFVAGGGALSVNLLAGQTTGYIETSNMQSVNLENMLNQANEFLYSFFPSASAISQVELRWGSSSTDYYARTVTVTQANTVFQNGWNLLSYQWSGITPVGSPDPSDITYVRVTWTYDGTLQTGVKANYLASRMGQFLEIEYYSKYLFRDSATGAYQETVTSDNNLINLDVESFNLLFNYVALLAVQQQQGVDANAHDGAFFQKLYDDGVKRYKGMYKSEVQKPTQTYYIQPNPNYARYLGTRRQW